MESLTISSTLPVTHAKEQITIPRLGFGVYRSPTDVCVKSCLTALKAGYRHIDSAQFYRNETEVGQAVAQSELKRSDVFLTTKILSAGGSVDSSYQKCVESVQKLDPNGGDKAYADLFLIHSPNAGSKARKEMWLALERLYEEGKAKSIGVSNWGIGHINEAKEYAKIWPPHVNQIELHPWCQQRDIVKFCEENKIVVQAYSPLVRNYKANDEVLLDLAKKYDRTTAQILVRWCLQKGWVPLPKSDTPERIVANADVYGFNLKDEDVKTLDDLDEGEAGSIVQWVKNTL
jgi:diketogulonate reductase-like aldo/keto reductase